MVFIKILKQKYYVYPKLKLIAIQYLYINMPIIMSYNALHFNGLNVGAEFWRKDVRQQIEVETPLICLFFFLLHLHSIALGP